MTLSKEEKIAGADERMRGDREKSSESIMKATRKNIISSRLASSHPDVQQALDAGTSSQQMDVATRIVFWAASEAGLDIAEIVVALAKKDPMVFDELCADMEEQQFKLFERADKTHLAFFDRARVYNACAWLAREVPHEAIYESIFATENTLMIADFFESGINGAELALRSPNLTKGIE